MNRYVQWYTLNYYVDLEVENIPNNVGDIHGVVFYDHLAPGSWVGNGLYDEREEPTLQGVKVQLYQDCSGFDLTITVTLARYKTADQKFIVMATSTDGAGANLMAKIPGRRPKPMKWNAAKNRWQKTFVNVPAPPATVTVSGPGVDSVTVDVTDIRP